MKFAIAFGFGFLFVKLFGAEGIFGVTAVAFVTCICSCNPGVFMGLAADYGEQGDMGNFAMMNIVSMLCYSAGFTPSIVSSFKRFGYGWHVDSGIHMLNMIVAGVFDRHPNLQMILGHWGELLPYYIDRFDGAMPAAFLGLKHEVSYYLQNNMYVTPSGVWTSECLEFCVKRLGVERIMFSINYPFANPEGQEKILEHPMLTQEQRELIAHGNAERLLKI